MWSEVFTSSRDEDLDLFGSCSVLSLLLGVLLPLPLHPAPSITRQFPWQNHLHRNHCLRLWCWGTWPNPGGSTAKQCQISTKAMVCNWLREASGLHVCFSSCPWFQQEDCDHILHEEVKTQSCWKTENRATSGPESLKKLEAKKQVGWE
jgi:hypothetical protein